MTLDEIDKQIMELQSLRKEKEKVETEQFLEKAKKHIGRCFIINEKEYAKVMSVPQKVMQLNRTELNRYQFPAVFLTEDEVPFRYDTLFSGAWGDGYVSPLFGDTYREITPDEFEAEFEKRLDSFRLKVLQQCG